MRNGFRNFLIIRFGALLSYLLPNSVIFCSKLALTTHLKVGFNESISIVIHNGVDTKIFKPFEDKERVLLRDRLFGIKSDLAIIGMVARYTQEKDFSNLFEALSIYSKHNSEYTLLLVGKGMTPENFELMSLAKKYGITEYVRLLGLKNNVPEIMAALDIHVMSSSVEGFGNVVAEAMACETPAIGTQTGAICEMIGASGWVVPVKNAPKLASAINLAIQERVVTPELWQIRRRLCRERIQQYFSIDSMVKSINICWIEDYQKLDLEKSIEEDDNFNYD
jgi:glycosyltransferase involved in cell wall biosynthesis